jgi:hypothetical protein
MYAAMNGHVRTAELLIAAGVDVADAGDDYGWACHARAP